MSEEFVLTHNIIDFSANTVTVERKLVAEANTVLSVANYEKSAAAARLLGVDPGHARLLLDAAGLISSGKVLHSFPLQWKVLREVNLTV